MYGKCLYESKHQLLISKQQEVNLEHFNDPKTSIKYSNDMKDDYKSIEECNIEKKRKVLIMFDDLIVDMIRDKNFHPVVTELFIMGQKLKNYFGVYYTGTHSCTKFYKSKHYALLHHEDSKQTRASTNCYQSVI